MACNLFCVINSRARSIRALRSSTLIGVAWSFIDFRLAIDGGNVEPQSAADSEGAATAAAAIVPACRKPRRENRVMSIEFIARHRYREAGRTVAGIGRKMGGREKSAIPNVR